MEDRQQEVTHLIKPMSPLPSVTASPASSPVLALATAVPNTSERWAAPREPLGVYRPWGAGLGQGWAAGAAMEQELPEQRQAAGKVLCFSTTETLLVYFCLCIRSWKCVCAHIFTYIYIHTYLPTNTCTKMRVFPQSVSFCKLQKYKRIKLSPLSLLSHQKLILHLLGIFFS